MQEQQWWKETGYAGGLKAENTPWNSTLQRGDAWCGFLQYVLQILVCKSCVWGHKSCPHGPRCTSPVANTSSCHQQGQFLWIADPASILSSAFLLSWMCMELSFKHTDPGLAEGKQGTPRLERWVTGAGQYRLYVEDKLQLLQNGQHGHQVHLQHGKRFWGQRLGNQLELGRNFHQVNLGFSLF